ncbi:ABC transporter permease [Thalassotalea euphylliae]|uniref:Transport permease protein n=1 Tax=Thalassotalea euphylliae TaxID=1655234 RepID=A0A3E0TMU8_9GAMM|nr:ABC transporter permease [Thalassotalea euphylliae]REL25723.1 ABC transporter permease [Thalassotalea euphylliae]
MNFNRFYAVFKARNLEFFRDKSSLGWNLLFPVLLLVGFAFVFGDDDKAVYKVGVLAAEYSSTESQHPAKPPFMHPFMQVKHIEFIHYQDLEQAKQKLTRHSVDLLIDLDNAQYWRNELSTNSYFTEKLFLAEEASFTAQTVAGEAIRYVDWVLPGILGMNMMFSCLFGVGYVIVRYRKNHVLKRLKATPLSALEFVSAQLLSRLFIVTFMSTVVFVGCNFMFDFYMLGSYFDLLVVAMLGAMSLITLGLLVASRSKSEELIGGLLNLTSWPMMLLSGVWFSLEGAPKEVQWFADILPLTHLVSAAREIMTEGATLIDVSYHVTVLAIMTSIFLALGAYCFSWNTDR